MSAQKPHKTPLVVPASPASEKAARMLDELPEFVLPGDDPHLDEALAKLSEGVEEGEDPLYVSARKRLARRMREAAVPANDALPGGAAPVREAAASGEIAPSRQAAGAPKKGVPVRWLVIAGLAILAPLLALA